MTSKARTSLRTVLRRLRGKAQMARGRAASSKPLCDNFGFSRGTPIDRYYIEAFLAEHASDVRGRVLEIGDDGYSRRFGGDRIAKQDVLHVSPDHPGATIAGDVSNAGTLPKNAFDCIIFTQTLHLIFETSSAIDSLYDALRPHGVLLLTSPGISPIDRGDWKDNWFWSVTPQSLSRLLSGPFGPDEVELTSYGNLFAATAFLHGASVEDTGTRRLNPRDEAYPVIVAARARRGG